VAVLALADADRRAGRAGARRVHAVELARPVDQRQAEHPGDDPSEPSELRPPDQRRTQPARPLQPAAVRVVFTHGPPCGRPRYRSRAAPTITRAPGMALEAAVEPAGH